MENRLMDVERGGEGQMYGKSNMVTYCLKVKSQSEVAQSSPSLCDPMDCSLPGSSIHGIFQARVLEWVAIAFSINGGQWVAKYNLGLLRNPQNLLRFIRSKPFSLLLSHKCTVKFSPGYLTYDIVSDLIWKQADKRIQLSSIKLNINEIYKKVNNSTFYLENELFVLTYIRLSILRQNVNLFVSKEIFL